MGNDLYLPSKRSRGMHLHDTPAWIMYGAIICACLAMLSVVIDHYDRRNNERHYRLFADVFEYIGWGLFGFSLLIWPSSGGHSAGNAWGPDIHSRPRPARIA
jgi:hypothetical protein